MQALRYADIRKPWTNRSGHACQRRPGYRYQRAGAKLHTRVKVEKYAPFGLVAERNIAHPNEAAIIAAMAPKRAHSRAELCQRRRSPRVVAKMTTMTRGQTK